MALLTKMPQSAEPEQVCLHQPFELSKAVTLSYLWR